MFLRRSSWELIQVTKITRSNRDKSPYNVHIKEKTGVLTCGQFKSVNNHSEHRAKAEAVISHKKYCLAKQIQILRGLDSFSLLLCVTSHLYQGSFFNLGFLAAKTVQFNTQQRPMTAPAWLKPCQTTRYLFSRKPANYNVKHVFD